jgi:2-C-methyl-D-erythritol 4-phosphate cytidylyltransferase
MKTSAIFLAGGRGLRMGSLLPKQFLPLHGRAIALYSLEILLQLEEIEEIIVVCPEEHRHVFSGMPVRFAPPGEQRQDSVYNGLQMVQPRSEWICIHDSARPFITPSLVKTLFEEGKQAPASSLALPVKNTLKEINAQQDVARTVDRSCIWEIQTPQLLKKEVLERGFAYAHAHTLSVTDDVSLAELTGHRVKLVRGSYQNIKITTPEDLFFAEWLVQTNTACASPMMAPAIAAGKSSPTPLPSKD